MKFTHKIQTSIQDTNLLNQIDGLTYLNWIYSISISQWVFVTKKKLQGKYTWILKIHNVEIIKPAFVNEILTLETWIGELNMNGSERFTRIFRDEELVVKSQGIWQVIDRKTSKPTSSISVIRNSYWF